MFVGCPFMVFEIRGHTIVVFHRKTRTLSIPISGRGEKPRPHTWKVLWFCLPHVPKFVCKFPAVQNLRWVEGGLWKSCILILVLTSRTSIRRNHFIYLKALSRSPIQLATWPVSQPVVGYRSPNNAVELMLWKTVSVAVWINELAGKYSVIPLILHYKEVKIIACRPDVEGRSINRRISSGGWRPPSPHRRVLVPQCTGC